METPTKGLEKPSISFVGGLDTKQDRLILKQKLSNSMASVPILKLQKSHSQQLEGVIELPIQSKQPIAVVFTKKNIP